MVKRILLLLLVSAWLTSCGFFGDTIFPADVSQEVEWLLWGDMREFYILDNGEDDELLIVATEDMGMVRVAIFDMALNIRGYMENGINGVSTDGVGFVDHNGDFIIGQTKISRFGTAEADEIEFVTVPNLMSNSAIIPYTDALTSTNYYLRIDQSGFIERYDSEWNTHIGQPLDGWSHITIRQNERYFSDVVFANQAGNLYLFTKEQLSSHADGTDGISLDTPSIAITDSILTQWITRCSRGYFVGTESGNYVLYGTDGVEIGRVESKDYSDPVVTIDFEGEYYFYFDKDRSRIVKERLPF